METKCPFANALKPELEPLPDRMKGLPIDERGFCVPWFVAWVDGKPEFRAMDRVKNILDDNLLACPRWHVEKVFAMLRRQKRRVGFTGGLEALSLEDYQVGLLADLTPRPNCFFAYDPGDAFETLESAARRMIAAGFTQRSHRLGCYVLIGYPKDTFSLATKRLTDIKRIGFTPRAMLWEPETASAERWRPVPEWHAFQRQWMRPKIIHARKPETEATR